MAWLKSAEGNAGAKKSAAKDDEVWWLLPDDIRSDIIKGTWFY